MSADFTPEKEDYGVLSPFKMQVLTNFPYIEADFDALTNYGLLCKVVEYLNNVISNENEVTEQVTSLYNAYVALQNYVNTYFDNLDLTGEVSAKLDEMAEDGSLTLLIKRYLDPYIATQNETIANFEIDVNQTLSDYNNKINGLYNYSPIPVSSIGSMTDTSKIYVNTTDGKWYYYDGDSWEIGGTYQSSSNDEFLNNESTNAVQNKTVTNALEEVIDITNGTEQTKTIIDPELTAGYVTANGNVVAGGDIYVYTNKIAVQEGDVVTILRHFSSSTAPNPIRYLCAYTDNTAIENKGSNTLISSYTVPADINYVVLTIGVNGCGGVIITRNDVPYQKTNNKDLIENKDYNTVTNVVLSVTSGYMDAKGIPHSNDSLYYSQKIEVNEGDLIIPLSTSTGKLRMVTAYRNNVAIEDSGSETNSDNYIVPFGINYIIVTANDTVSNIVKISKQKGKYVINKTLGCYQYIGNINEKVEFDYCNISYDYAYSFSSKITTLDKISFGLTNASDEFTPFFEIDATKIYYAYDDTMREIMHNLTLSNSISIKIEDDNEHHGQYKVHIYSNGEEYTNSDTVFVMPYTNGKPTININNSVLTNSVISFTPKNISKDIWLFGDSWLSYSNKRMPYYLIENNNYKNVFINNFSGEGSVKGLDALTNLLKLNKPRYLLWLYGMNDSDTSSGVNNNWLTSLQSVISLCKTYNIELILATIPDTNTQIMKHKNKIVRNSGYRYVDQEIALTSSVGTWISGYQSADGNHPTELGAKALYYRFISDVPELLNN